jgi:diguanylate cyclase (GGDEF)-like protein
MSDITIIGNTKFSKGFQDVLKTTGYTFSLFSSLKDSLAITDLLTDLFIIDVQQYRDTVFKDFIKKTADIPKIIISETIPARGMQFWMHKPHSYPVTSPGKKELRLFVRNILIGKTAESENKALKQELSTVTQELDFYKEINQTLTYSLELNDVLTTIMKKAQEVTHAEAWSVILIEQNTGDLQFKITEEKRKTKEIQRYRLKAGEGICGWVAQKGVPVLIPDVTKDKRYFDRIDKLIRFKTKSIMCVPIRCRGQVIGVFEVINKTSRKSFSEDDLGILVKLVDQARIAIEIASLYQKMADLVITDDLTKLFNTRYLNRTIDMEIQRSIRYRSSVSLIFLDIDYFKKINDQYGHLVGSKVLVEMGQLLLNNLRAVDIVTRYGGDEFVIVLPQTPPSAAAQIADRIRTSIEQNLFLSKEGYSLKITASFGVASYPEAAKSKEELLKIADEAMYRIKYQRGNGVFSIAREGHGTI